MIPEDVKTLRDLWMWHNLSSQDMADRTGLSRETLYKMNRKEGGSTRSIFKVCKVLGITRAEYNKLEKCPKADHYRQP